jgi:hypothetical protein
MTLMRCCCGEYVLDNGEPRTAGLWTHEARGTPGEFCGRSYKHELRDLRAALWRVDGVAAAWELDLNGSAWSEDEANRVEACARDLRAVLAGTSKARWNLCWSCGYQRKETHCTRYDIDDPSVMTCDGFVQVHDVETFPDPRCPCELCARGSGSVVALGGGPTGGR